MLPIQVLINTYRDLGDWRFTAQEAYQIVTSVWESAIKVAAMAAMFGMVGSWVGEKLTPEEELAEVLDEIKLVSFKLQDLEQAAADARAHFMHLMSSYGYSVIPPLTEMRKHHDLVVQKKRWEELERRAERTRGCLFKLTKRKKELTGEA